MDLINAVGHFFHGIVSYLFDNNGIMIIKWYIICLINDFFIGTYRSMVKSKFKSRSYLQGLCIKFLALTAIPATNGLDEIYNKQWGQLTIQGWPIDFSDILATLLLIYEVFSILENLYALGALPKSIIKFLEKILDKTNFKDMYPKDKDDKD
ncbi:hypothetical protein DY037_07180 [Apilactobacillus micheneri]|uniref:phage holin family protein n=1 Tax=Apilactobacillus micheneri TaxID=1899430 RepID=UPI001126810B|nr:phage holin family protein [Apilactobacillus micheneri]TPR48167.1 hypothetical protein DY037_07180 [Apilactobacillus micheneri]